jgi:hypothetical protein
MKTTELKEIMQPNKGDILLTGITKPNIIRRLRMIVHFIL